MAKYEDAFLLKDKVSESLNKINKNLESFQGKLKGAEVQLADFRKRTEKITQLGQNLTSFGQKMTVGVTLPIVGLGAAMVKSAADMESMQQQLSTMLGSELEGVKMFDEIKTMAAKTPFGTKDLMSATNTMLGFGISQEKVLPLMQQLGDISGGNADRFQSLALAFSQVSSAGKLQGQDLLQMINAGFNPLEQIAKRTGKSVGYWKEQMSKGAISVEMVEQAMKDATSEGGRFYKMMEKQSGTALGQWSTFMDNLNSVLAEFGKIILPTAIAALQKLSKALEWLNNLSPGTKKLILILGGLLAAVGPLLTVLGTLSTSILSIYTAMNMLKFATLATTPAVTAAATATTAATAPFALWAAAIMGVVAALSALGIALKHVRRMQEINNMDSIKTSNLSNENLQKLSYEYQMTKNKKNFEEKYGKNVANAVKNYNKTTNNNTATTHNYFSGNITLSGNDSLNAILAGGGNMPLYSQ